jgi:hypothetical protein
VFWKAPPVRSIGRIMPGDWWFGRDLVTRTRIFLWPFHFIGCALKLCWLLISWGMFSFHGASGEWHGSWGLRTSNGGSSLGGDEELAWWFVPWSSGMLVEATAQEKFIVLPFRVKIQGLALTGFVWQCPCWRFLYWEWGLSFGWNHMIYDRAMMVLVHCSLLGGVAFRQAGLLVLSWWC